MRKVDRGVTDEPKSLKFKNLTDAKKNHLTNGKHDSDFYGSDEVWEALRDLYYNKCYICEVDVESDGEVEHYFPKSERPELGYTWSNLHISCPGCNKAKNNNDFKVFEDDGSLVSMNLLDPSTTDYDINDYMSLNSKLKWTLNDINKGNDFYKKAKQTVKYLNGIRKYKHSYEQYHIRSTAVLAFNTFLSNSVVPNKFILKDIEHNLEHYRKPHERELRKCHKELLNSLEKLHDEYLSSRAEFSTYLRQVFWDSFQWTYDELVEVITVFRRELR